jgi:hypothetical protein
MALIRDNRGSLLASNLSQYLAGAANTAGTPVDTNELVRIVNQFLGTGEQISSDINTISNGIYKKFGTIDKVTNRTEIVTSGIWSGDTGSLNVQANYTSSAQVVSTSGRYYLDVYNTTATGSGEVQFSIAYGDAVGFGAPTISQNDDSTSPTKATYNQYKNVLLDSSDNYFSVYTGSTAGGADMTSFYAININRARYKERLDPGNISIDFSGSVRSITLIDDSGGTDENVTTAGRVYNLVSGSLNIGSALSASIATTGGYSAEGNGQGYGLFYPDMGIILLNPKALAAACDPRLAEATSSAQGIYHQTSTSASVRVGTSGSIALLEALAGGADFQVRRTENVSTSHYFVRANNREFNFSNNPTFVTGSVGAFVNPLFERDPHVYITSVGLYDDANELLAVAKTSKPIEKSFDKEIAIKVKLDF